MRQSTPFRHHIEKVPLHGRHCRVFFFLVVCRLDRLRLRLAPFSSAPIDLPAPSWRLSGHAGTVPHGRCRQALRRLGQSTVRSSHFSERTPNRACPPKHANRPESLGPPGPRNEPPPNESPKESGPPGPRNNQQPSPPSKVGLYFGTKSNLGEIYYAQESHELQN